MYVVLRCLFNKYSKYTCIYKLYQMKKNTLEHCIALQRSKTSSKRIYLQMLYGHNRR